MAWNQQIFGQPPAITAARDQKKNRKNAIKTASTPRTVKTVLG
jgi:hypothetical protein